MPMQMKSAILLARTRTSLAVKSVWAAVLAAYRDYRGESEDADGILQRFGGVDEDVVASFDCDWSNGTGGGAGPAGSEYRDFGIVDENVGGFIWCGFGAGESAIAFAGVGFARAVQIQRVFRFGGKGCGFAPAIFAQDEMANARLGGKLFASLSAND